MNAPRPYTDDEFEKMRKLHAPWELAMLQSAAKILSQPPPDAKDSEAKLRRWMAIEGFYIHLRTLDAFFYGEDRGRRRDAFATHFFEDGSTWCSLRPGRSAAMEQAVNRAGTMVAHLSYDRQTAIDAGEKLEWLKLAEEMNAVWQVFRDATKTTKRGILLDDGFVLLPPNVFAGAVSYGSETTVSTPGDIGAYLGSFLSE